MRLLLKNKSALSILWWTQRVLFTCAFLLLGYCGFVLVNAWIFQYQANAALERLIRDKAGVSSYRPPTEAPAIPQDLRPVVNGDLIGRLDVPRLNLSVIVVEGTGKPALRRAAGHIVGTGLPGQPGNVGVAAHRDTFFRPRFSAHCEIFRITI